MTSASCKLGSACPAPARGRPAVRLALCVLAAAVALSAGCVSTPTWNPFRRAQADTPAPTGDSLVLDGGTPAPGPTSPEFEKAMDLFRQEKYPEAQTAFHKVSRSKKTSPGDAEAALYYEAECLRMQSRYPKAAEVYGQLLKEYPRRAHHHEALQRMFDIANYWLDETRDVMEARETAKGGWVMPVSYVHWDKTKPVLDMQGRALQLLETVYLNDIDGPLGEKALFYLGSINFSQESYEEADHYFYQVVKFHPNGELAPRALKLSIICKQMATGGSPYDGRKLAEARKLIQTAAAAYPELAHQDADFLQRQVATINLQQADADFEQAEFYKRTGHPGSAYFYYEIVRRRYPGTKYAEKAAERMGELRERAERQKQANPTGKSWLPTTLPTLPTLPWRRPAANQPGEDGVETAPIPAPQQSLDPGTPLTPYAPGAPEMAPPPRPVSQGGPAGVQPVGAAAGAWPR